jgi:plasmid segregation protein ParM
MKLNVKVGNDNGNAEHDIIIDGKVVTQPNVFCKISKLPNLEEISSEYVVKNIENHLIVSITSPSLNNHTPATYYVGSYATVSGNHLKNIEVGAQNAKLDSDIPVVNTLAQISGYAVKKAFSKDATVESIEVNVDMSSALPVTQYSKKNAKEFAGKFLNGTHLVTVHLGSKRIDVSLKFEYVKVLPESVPVVWYLKGLNENNTIFAEFNKEYDIKADGKYFSDKRILHLAIGEGTLEVPLTDGVRFDPNFIKGSNNGVGHAINAVIDEFIVENGLSKFSRQDFSNVLRTPSHKYFSSASQLILNPLEEQSNTILRIAKDEVGKANNDVDVICVHGGGSILMKEFLYSELKSFCDKTKIKLFYIPKEEAVTLEAKGMFTFVSDPTFERLKSKYIEANTTV